MISDSGGSAGIVPEKSGYYSLDFSFYCLTFSALTFSGELPAINLQCCFGVKVDGFVLADAFDRDQKLPRPRIQIVADASQHRDEQQRQNQKARFVVPPQLRDKAISFSKRRAAARAEVGIVSDAGITFQTIHTNNLNRLRAQVQTLFGENTCEIDHCGGIFGTFWGDFWSFFTGKPIIKIRKKEVNAK